MKRYALLIFLVFSTCTAMENIEKIELKEKTNESSLFEKTEKFLQDFKKSTLNRRERKKQNKMLQNSSYKKIFNDEYYEEKAKKLIFDLIITKMLKLSINDMTDDAPQKILNDIYAFLEEYEQWYTNMLPALTQEKNLNKNADKMELKSILEPSNQSSALTACLIGALGKRISINMSNLQPISASAVCLHQYINEIVVEGVKAKFNCKDEDISKCLNYLANNDIFILNEALVFIGCMFKNKEKETIKSISLTNAQELSTKQEKCPSCTDQSIEHNSEFRAVLPDQDATKQDAHTQQDLLSL